MYCNWMCNMIIQVILRKAKMRTISRKWLSLPFTTSGWVIFARSWNAPEGYRLLDDRQCHTTPANRNSVIKCNQCIQYTPWTSLNSFWKLLKRWNPHGPVLVHDARIQNLSHAMARLISAVLAVSETPRMVYGHFLGSKGKVSKVSTRLPMSDTYSLPTVTAKHLRAGSIWGSEISYMANVRPLNSEFYM